ncbi:hypothetical protein ACE41H_02070 [Paenibacillus enshidis]|uniref:Uncharacterized protein n=1 Tax=Paenibacillus enshidis TaxID=1458439 RepID=A0ABV5AN08_9BACL
MSEFYIEKENLITKSKVVALREFLDSMAKEAKAKGVNENDLLHDLEQVREEMWSEPNYISPSKRTIEIFRTWFRLY